MIFRMIVAVSAIAIGVAAAVANPEAIAARQAVMKANGAQATQGAKFMKGEEPFDLAKAQNVFAVYASGAAKAVNLFPADSKSGDTAALPAIWEKNDDFKARMARFEADAKAALAAVKDEATFKTSFPTVMRNCGGCHEIYRAKRS